MRNANTHNHNPFEYKLEPAHLYKRLLPETETES